MQLFYAVASLVLSLALCGGRATAHESLPAYLSLSEATPGAYSVMLRVPATQGTPPSLAVRLPDACEAYSAPGRTDIPGALVEHWTVRCREPGLAGGEVRIVGLENTVLDALVRIDFADGRSVTQLLHPSDPSFAVPGGDAPAGVGGYFVLGVEHILYGIDHLLFVTGLVLIVRHGRRLIRTVTAFTAAHSITLAAATLGYVHVPPAPVEATIALSIVFLACELVRLNQGQAGLTARAPWIVAFVFGLLHGFGFAGALAEIGLPPHDIPLALLLFNLGVEAGQLAFVAVLLLAIAGLSRIRVAWPFWTRHLAPYGIGTVAAFWLIGRLVIAL